MRQILGDDIPGSYICDVACCRITLMGLPCPAVPVSVKSINSGSIIELVANPAAPLMITVPSDFPLDSPLEITLEVAESDMINYKNWQE